MDLAALFALEHIAYDVRNVALGGAKVLVRARAGVVQVNAFSMNDAREATVFKLHCQLSVAAR